MDEFDIYRLRAKAKHAAYKSLGVPNVACICGETDPISFDKEHVFRSLYDDTIYGMCATCHRKKSRREQLEFPPVGVHPGDPFERMGHALLGIYQYLSFITEHIRRMADFMFKLAGKGIVIEE